MAARPHENEGSTLDLDHLDTNRVTAALRPRARTPRRTRELRRATRRTTLSSITLIGVALAVLFGGGAMLSGASGSPAGPYDPGANTVRAIGGAPSFGPATGMQLNANFVDIAATPSGRGYWTAASDGGVFTFGDAQFLGSVGDRVLARPVVGIAATKSGHGYWLVASDGGVFAFGDAAFHGSAANSGANIVAIAPTPSGNGYWLVGSDGGVFSFGDAAFEGAATSFAHGALIVAMAPTRSGYGYLLLGADGGVFAFGDARFQGSAVDGQHLATGIAIPSNGRGYEIARTDGSVVGLGGASSSPAPVDFLAGQHPVIAIATRPGGGAWLATTYLAPTPVVSQSPSQDPFLKCTRAHESDMAGGYRAVSPDGVYRGAYQFLRSTWNNVARAAGRPDLVGVDPAAATPADQDQIALFLFQHGGSGPWGGRCQGLA
ncbi:MAG TPA: hypothetical protein VGP92_14420 [Acidimicrobiia bacterium]|nr:hypothetical protein [Acidimicrobiia bacterium]